MRLYRLIRTAYICFTIYALLITDVTTLEIKDTLPAVILMWNIFFAFFLGYKTYEDTESAQIEKKEVLFLDDKRLLVLLLGVLSVVCSLLAAKYYTGQWPSTVLNGLSNSKRSLYYEYQLHAQLQNIASFSLQKIPYILMMFYVKFSLFYFSITFLLVKKKIAWFETMTLVLVIVAHIYFGLARGTNYELFEIVMLAIFIILTKKNKNKYKSRMGLKFVIIIGIVGVMVFLFYQRVRSRGYKFDYMYNPDYDFNPGGVISTLSQSLVFLIILLYDYFGFGFYYVSKYIMEVWLITPIRLFEGLLPHGFSIENTTIMETVSSIVKMGARWHPDIILLINSFGMVMSLILLFFLGRFSAYITKIDSGLPITRFTEFVILLQMVSFPIGNLIFTSSASTLIVYLLVGVWLWKFFIKKSFVFGL